MIVPLLALCAAVAACGKQSAAPEPAVEPPSPQPVVETRSGAVKGVANEAGTVTAYKGIPYAAPPVGELRWRPPQPAPSWDGVRDASAFGSSCVQDRVYTHLPNGPWTEEFMVQNEVSEDCLFLNVWTPSQDGSGDLAVFVYIHGGGLTEGSGAIDVYDGEELAKKGVVVVTINYRLGVVGFLAHPELTAESPEEVSGNYGLLDQMAALRWVRDNIGAFGGDPQRVTIAGQSAGAGSVRALTASPLASGLFHGAITQSGSSLVGFRVTSSLEDAEIQGAEYAESKGAASIAELRAMEAMDLLPPAPAPGQPRVRFAFVVDGRVLTGTDAEVYERGEQNDTPFITGMNRDELRFRGEKSDEFSALYAAGPDGDISKAEQVAAEEQSRLNAFLWMELRAGTSDTDGYIYYFDQAIPWPEHPEFGAFHTGEMPYVFNNLKMLDRPWTEVDRMVADAMSSYWVNFVKTGDPNGTGLPAWSAFDSDRKEVMRIGAEMGMIPIAASEERLSFVKEQLLAE